jgi:RNA polymerase sigma-70 factor (sigma-E family)
VVPGADRSGFEEFVVARRPALLRTAYLLTGSHADAEDLVQMALIKTVPHWKRIADQPEAYVRTVLARESVSRWRRRRWREVPTGDLPDHRQPVADLDQRLMLRRALGSLPPRQRAVIVLRYYDDLTEKETASVLGIAVGTVKSQARDGLSRLRERLPDLDVDFDEQQPKSGRKPDGGARRFARRPRPAP